MVDIAEEPYVIISYDFMVRTVIPGHLELVKGCRKELIFACIT